MTKNPLPVRAGISPSRLYLPQGDWSTLLAFLKERFPHLAEDIIEMRLARGDMVNEEGTPYHLHSPYPAQTWLWYYREVEQEVTVPFELKILYQDDYLVAVDKPHFLASIPGGRYLQETALIRLRKMLDNYDISPLHRLDRDTAGVLLFCVNPQYRGIYQSLFQGRSIQKQYECVAPYQKHLKLPLLRQSFIEKSASYFTMQEREGSIYQLSLDNSISQQPIIPEHADCNSATWIELIQHKNGLGHYRLTPLSGKKHQLRAHMNGLGMAICHDEFYPQLLPARAADDFARPLQLLARSIAFIDPINQQQRYFESQQTLALVKDW